jgi:hypothetical protein
MAVEPLRIAPVSPTKSAVQQAPSPYYSAKSSVSPPEPRRQSTTESPSGVARGNVVKVLTSMATQPGGYAQQLQPTYQRVGHPQPLQPPKYETVRNSQLNYQPLYQYQHLPYEQQEYAYVHLNTTLIIINQLQLFSSRLQVESAGIDACEHNTTTASADGTSAPRTIATSGYHCIPYTTTCGCHAAHTTTVTVVTTWTQHIRHYC